MLARARWVGGLLVLLGLLTPVVDAYLRTQRRAADGESEVRGPFRPEMVWLPAGTFTMGSGDAERAAASAAGVPSEWLQRERLHEVTLTEGFALARTEVTQAQWVALMGENPSFFDGFDDSPNFPVDSVSWFDAVLYLNRLTETESGLTACYSLEGCRDEAQVNQGCGDGEAYCLGAHRCKSVRRVSGCTGYRLPTEAEWEYAARAGTVDSTYGGPFEAEGVVAALARFGESAALVGSRFDCSAYEVRDAPETPCGPSAVGQLAPNPWGLSDTLGNVWEWVEDDYDEAYFLDATTTSTTNPGRLKDGRYAVYRGCGFYSGPARCRAAFRVHGGRALRRHELGFRPARSGSPRSLNP